MERDPQELQFLTVPEIVKESVSIPRSSSRIFALITLTLVFPLSFAILAHSLFTHPILQQIQSPETTPHRYHHEYLLLLLYQLLYLLFLFAFSLLSTAAVVFTVASIYTSKPISFSSTLSAVPRVLYRLFITYLWISLLMATYNLIFIAVVFALLTYSTANAVAFSLLFIVFFILFLFAHIYITALWHLASVVSVLEPVYGFAAMKKSRELLRGKAVPAGVIVFLYLFICGIIGGVFGGVVVRGGESFGVWTRILVGGFCVGVLVVVNLVGLLVQSVFYYVCKSYHHQGIDKSALYDHLGGYLGEYVPLKSSIQMESLEM